MTDSTLQLLRSATNEELDPLVEYIKDATISEWLTISDAYKKHAPDHSKYVDVIYDEIRKFGGNTFANLGREIMSKPQREYIELVRDVADKFSVKDYKQYELEDLEKALVYKVREDFMKKASPEQIHELEEILKKQGKGKVNVKGMAGDAYGSAGLAYLILSRAAGPFALISGIASPAFRVVVPCVLYIALLRNKKADQAAVDSLKGAFDDD